MSTYTPMELFVGLSSVLTGIDATKLAPALDPNNVKQIYFDTAKAKGGATFDQLLQIYAANATQPPAAIAAAVFEQSGPAVCFLARAIMLAWYLGSWYQPSELQKYSVPNPPAAPIASTVISPDAYTQGWAWNVAQAHPMGYSNFTFGYWANKPPSLDDFVQGASA